MCSDCQCLPAWFQRDLVGVTRLSRGLCAVARPIPKSILHPVFKKWLFFPDFSNSTLLDKALRPSWLRLQRIRGQLWDPDALAERTTPVRR
jgi:hypothetical protein